MTEASAEAVLEIRRLTIWAVWIVIVALLVLFAWRLLFLAFAGVLLAIALDGVAEWVQQHSPLGRSRSYAATVVGLLLFIALAGWFIVPRVITQTIEIGRLIPGSLAESRKWLDRFQWGKYVVRFANQSILNLHPASQLAMAGEVVFRTAADAVVVAIVGFYAALHPREYVNAFLHLVPGRHRAIVRQVGSAIVYTLRWWLLGQLVPMLALGIVSMAGLWLLGVPLAFTLGVITGVMIFVPYLGALIAEIPAVLVALKISPRTVLYVVILYLVIHSVEAYILTPLVQRRAVRVLPIVSILAQYLMWLLTGVLGVALATPLAAAATTTIKVLYLHEDVRP